MQPEYVLSCRRFQCSGRKGSLTDRLDSSLGNLDNLIRLLGVFQLLRLNLLSSLLDIEVGEQVKEPALDGGIAHLVQILFSLHLCELGTGFVCLLVGIDFQILFHQGHGQALIGTLLLNLLFRSNGGQGVAGLHGHCVHQCVILGLGGIAGHLEVELGTDDGLVDVIEGEVSSGNGSDSNSGVRHDDFLSGSLGLGGRSQP